MAKKRNSRQQQEEFSQDDYSSNIELVEISDYVKEKVIVYGVNVSVARACASIDDGLIPVCRRIIWAMYHDAKVLPSGRYVKVPEFLFVTSKYHPHGNQSIEKTFYNMIKPWETNAILIDVDNNSGSLTGEGSSAVRYLDAKLSQYCFKCFFEEFDSSIIDMVPNYIQTCDEPVVLPARYPNFLINSVNGIAWGNAITIPPFNLEEIFRLTQALIENPGMTKVYLFPDSPRGYDIIDDGSILKVCETGIGTVKIRARMEYVEDGNYISVTGFPERTTMDSIVKKIHDLIQNKDIIDIDDIADKSGIGHAEFWIRLKKNADPYSIIETLYKKTDLESYAQINLNFADRTKMLQLGLKDSLIEWIERRIDMKQRYYIKRLSSQKDRKMKLESIVSVLSDRTKWQKASDLIEQCDDDSDIISILKEELNINTLQADMVSNISLRQKSKNRLEKYKQELDEIDDKIRQVETLVRSKQNIKDKIYDELEEGIRLFAKPRNCRIIKLSDIKKHKIHYRIVVTKNYIKKLSINGNVIGYIDRDDEIVAYYPDVTEDDTIFVVDNYGMFHKLNISKLPSNDPVHKGTELLKLGIKGMVVRTINISNELLQNSEYVNNCDMVVFTTSGIIKASPLSQYIKSRGDVQGILLSKDDSVCYVSIRDRTDARTNQKLIYTKNGMGIVVDLNSVSVTDRLTKGTRHLRLEDDVIRGICDSDSIDELYIITVKGYGKRCDLDDILTASKRKDNMARLTGLNDGDEVFKILPVTEETSHSKIVFQMQSGERKEIFCSDIEKTTRVSKGKKLIGVKRGDSIMKIKIN